MAAHPTSPSWLVITTLNDRRGGVDRYWSRLADLDVPTPETILISLDEDGNSPGWEAEQILREMEQRGWDRGFVRTAQKAAPDHLEHGSIIHEATLDEVNRTVESLLGQIEMSE